NLPVQNFWQKFIEINKTMYTANAGLAATHPFSSRLHEWPLGSRPIYYWNKTDASTQKSADIWLIGNPVSWLLAAFAVFITLFKIPFKFGLRVFSAESRRRFNEITFLLILGYFANLLPFIFVGRVAFLYHYLPALTFALILLAIKIDRMLGPRKSPLIFLGLLILSFLILTPLSYGLPMSQKILELEQMIVRFFG
ncbi:MAG: hypothetical protein Q8L57_00175, partial [bacterium]|nr:hypothetical protein [bacterium]